MEKKEINDLNGVGECSFNGLLMVFNGEKGDEWSLMEEIREMNGL